MSCSIWPCLSLLFHLRKQHLSISIQWYSQSFHLSWWKETNIDFIKNANIRIGIETWSQSLFCQNKIDKKWLSIIVSIKSSYARLVFHNEQKWLLIVSVFFAWYFLLRCAEYRKTKNSYTNRDSRKREPLWAISFLVAFHTHKEIFYIYLLCSVTDGVFCESVVLLLWRYT